MEFAGHAGETATLHTITVKFSYQTPPTAGNSTAVAGPTGTAAVTGVSTAATSGSAGPTGYNPPTYYRPRY